MGDYAVELDGEIVAAVERKTLADLCARLVEGNLRFSSPSSASSGGPRSPSGSGTPRVFKLEHVAPGFVAELLATVQVRYPAVPIVFCETRPLAEEWTFRYLGAALAYARAEADAGG